MDFDVGIRLNSILENQEKQFTIDQYIINLLEAIAKNQSIDLKEIQQKTQEKS